LTVRLTWQQALAWRMQRQLLDPIGSPPVDAVVRQLCGVQAQVASSAELAVRLRRQDSRPGEVNAALADGRLIKMWAMRGTLHLLTPGEAGAFVSLIGAGRLWERPSWVRYFGMTPKHWDAFRDAVRRALDGQTLTREELITAVVRDRMLRHLKDALRSGWGTLLTPLAWQGELCSGPSRGGRATFMRPQDASSDWAGVPEPDDAAPVVMAAYFSAYGPATV
jgi:hypothetical protein